MSNAEARTSANQHTGIPVMQCLRIWKVFALLLMAALTQPVAAQIEPSTAQVNLYFPQLADGGPRSQQWQTSFVFLNPSTTSVAGVVLLIYNNDGSPLTMDFGSGANSQFNFAIPPQGTVVLRSRMLSSQTVTGWAQAAASIPVEGTVLFTDFTNGVAQFQVSAASTLPQANTGQQRTALWESLSRMCITTWRLR